MRCLDQKTDFETQDNNLKQIGLRLTTELVMREKGNINIYHLRTLPTTANPREWINLGYHNTKSGIFQEYYATEIIQNGKLRAIEPGHYTTQTEEKITPEKTIEAIRSHMRLVNDIRLYGGEEVILSVNQATEPDR